MGVGSFPTIQHTGWKIGWNLHCTNENSRGSAQSPPNPTETIEEPTKDLPAKNDDSKFCQAVDFNAKTAGVKMSVFKVTGSKERQNSPF